MVSFTAQALGDLCSATMYFSYCCCNVLSRDNNKWLMSDLYNRETTCEHTRLTSLHGEFADESHIDERHATEKER